MPRSRRPSLNIRRQRSSSRCPASAPSSGPPCCSAPTTTCIPQRRASRCRRRTRARPQRLRPAHRQPAPTVALQSIATTRVLPIRADQHDARWAQPRLLPQEASPGATHNQAVIALARRRVDVLWALLRENRTWTATPPPARSGRLTTPLRFPMPGLGCGHQPGTAGRGW